VEFLKKLKQKGERHDTGKMGVERLKYVSGKKIKGHKDPSGVKSGVLREDG
jgi:hypothetical protein